MLTCVIINSTVKLATNKLLSSQQVNIHHCDVHYTDAFWRHNDFALPLPFPICTLAKLDLVHTPGQVIVKSILSLSMVVLTLCMKGTRVCAGEPMCTEAYVLWGLQSLANHLE